MGTSGPQTRTGGDFNARIDSGSSSCAAFCTLGTIDGMTAPCVATAWLMLPHLGPGDSRTPAMVLNPETRDELRGKVPLADQPDE